MGKTFVSNVKKNQFSNVHNDTLKLNYKHLLIKYHCKAFHMYVSLHIKCILWTKKNQKYFPLPPPFPCQCWNHVWRGSHVFGKELVVLDCYFALFFLFPLFTSHYLLLNLLKSYLNRLNYVTAFQGMPLN